MWVPGLYRIVSYRTVPTQLIILLFSPQSLSLTIPLHVRPLPIPPLLPTKEKVYSLRVKEKGNKSETWFYRRGANALSRDVTIYMDIVSGNQL